MTNARRNQSTSHEETVSEVSKLLNESLPGFYSGGFPHEIVVYQRARARKRVKSSALDEQGYARFRIRGASHTSQGPGPFGEDVESDPRAKFEEAPRLRWREALGS